MERKEPIKAEIIEPNSKVIQVNNVTSGNITAQNILNTLVSEIPSIANISIKQYIAVSLVPAGRIEFVYHTIRQTTVISQFLSVTEFYYGTFGSISVSEMQSADR